MTGDTIKPSITITEAISHVEGMQGLSKQARAGQGWPQWDRDGGLHSSDLHT